MSASRIGTRFASSLARPPVRTLPRVAFAPSDDEGGLRGAMGVALLAAAAGLTGWKEEKADCTAIAAVVGKEGFVARYACRLETVEISKNSLSRTAGRFCWTGWKRSRRGDTTVRNRGCAGILTSIASVVDVVADSSVSGAGIATMAPNHDSSMVSARCLSNPTNVTAEF